MKRFLIACAIGMIASTVVGQNLNDLEYQSFTWDDSTNVAARGYVTDAGSITNRLPLHLNDRQRLSYTYDDEMNVAVRVVVSNPSGGGGSPVDARAVTNNIDMGANKLYSGETKIDLANGVIWKDETANERAMHITSLILYDVNNGIAVNFGDGELHDWTGITVLDWQQNQLIGDGANVSLDWDGRTLNDSAANPVYEWNLNKMHTDLNMNSNSIVGIATNSLTFTDGSSISVDGDFMFYVTSVGDRTQVMTTNEAIDVTASEGYLYSDTDTQLVFRALSASASFAVGDMTVDATTTNFNLVHDLGEQYLSVFVYDQFDNWIIPDNIEAESATNCKIHLDSLLDYMSNQTWNVSGRR